MTSPEELNFEVVTMPWYCLDCRTKFEGPTDRPPNDGCPACQSRNVIDLNADTVSRAETYRALQRHPRADRFQFMFGRKLLKGLP